MEWHACLEVLTSRREGRQVRRWKWAICLDASCPLKSRLVPTCWGGPSPHPCSPPVLKARAHRSGSESALGLPPGVLAGQCPVLPALGKNHHESTLTLKGSESASGQGALQTVLGTLPVPHNITAWGAETFKWDPGAHDTHPSHQRNSTFLLLHIRLPCFILFKKGGGFPNFKTIRHHQSISKPRNTA